MIRLLHAALVARARDHRYETAVWIDKVLYGAGQLVSRRIEEPIDGALAALAVDTARHVADGGPQLHRDRFGVPETLHEALAASLVLYLVAWPPR